jgi:hypothetical protein
MHRDRAALRELDGVARQIHEDLAHVHRAAHQLVRHVGADGQVERELLAVGLDLQGAQGGVQQLVKVELDAFELEAAGLDPGDVQDVADQRQRAAPTPNV